MSRGNTDNLKRAARLKRQTAIAKAEKGLRRLLKEGRPITFQTVAAEAGVSKDFLYRTTDLRERIMDLRQRTAPRPKPSQPHIPDPAQAGTSSIIRILTTRLTEERANNRKRISELEAALAAAQGQLLQLRRLTATQSDPGHSSPNTSCLCYEEGKCGPESSRLSGLESR
ncbi:DUF6262 family protein [Arthrobacter sp. ISL-65]|uniref:DUF6262 family protein n=1 Tax=Arthrobacter sp. ISL-65 TaxID=2819112 RepID=UPI0035A8B55C